MTCWTAFLSVVFPPLAVLDKGCGVILLVTLLWMAGGVPGMIAALIINGMKPPRPRYVHVPSAALNAWDDVDDYTADAGEEKMKGAFIRLADGEIAEVIEDDGALPGANDGEKRKRDW